MPALSNPQYELFCNAYVADFDGQKAAIAAGYTPKSARFKASLLIRRPEIANRLTELVTEIAQKYLEIPASRILELWSSIATADANALTQYRIGPCRYCHGIDHEYQWKTRREYRDELKAWQARNPKKDINDDSAPNDAGGFGYKITGQPNPDCPECAGLGVGYAHFNDTTKLAPEVKPLFQGVKITANGAEIILADQAKALENLAKRYGLLKEQVEVETGGQLSALLREIQVRQSQAPIVRKPQE